MARAQRWSLLLLESILVLVLASCPSSPQRNGDARTAAPPAPAKAAAGELTLAPTDAPGLTFRLREGTVGGAREVVPPAKATPLDDAAVKKVLARLPAMVVDPADQKEFALRERSLPAPRTGKTVKDAFPPPQTAPPPDPTEAGELQVLRHMPDGDVPLAPKVSVTFSQPMVPITSYTELEKLPVPVQLTPMPTGRWRWIGTKTLLFEARGASERLPMATTYTVEVPAGTKSQTGGTLAAASRFTFTTPTVTVQQFWPQNGPVRRDPVMFASFDQKIDQAAVLASISARANGQTVALRLATADEISADDATANAIAALEADGQGDRWIAFRAAALLPVDTYVTVDIGPGTPSAEGPRKTEKVQQYGFRTYGPMRITNKNCQEKDRRCPPFSTLWVEFTNPIDGETFQKDMIKVEPAIAGMKVVASGDTLSISGSTKGRTTYKVTYDGRIPDTFGQTMGQSDAVTFFTGPAEKALFAMGGEFVVVDPVGGPRYSVFSVNHSSLRVKLFAAGPDTFNKYKLYMRDTFRRERFPPDPPLTLISNELVPVKGEPDDLTETRIDLSKALTRGAGSVLIWVEPPERPKERWQWNPVVVWAQVTNIGLDAMVDHDELIGWATDLKDGKPLSGVELSVVPAGLKGTTDGGGVARMPLVETAGAMLVAKKGNDVAFLPESTSYWNDGASWRRNDEGDTLRWYIADDRKMYKPGEEVKIKGFIRRIGGGEQGDVMGFDGAASKVTYTLKDSRGNDILTGEATLSPLGGFDTSFKLPGNMNLGQATLAFQAVDDRVGGGYASHAIEVQEFRRPEFEVGAQASQGPFFLGGNATVTVTASYYAGGGLVNAETNWTVSASPGSYRPPGHDGFVFGRQPSWYDGWTRRSSGPRVRGRGRPIAPPRGGGQYQEFHGKTDSAGKHLLGLDFLGVNPPEPTNVHTQAVVMDVNRQAWAASADLLVHPANIYVGVKLERPFLQKGQPIKLEAIVTDLDGKVVSGKKIDVRSVRMDWDYEDGEVKVKEVDPKECGLTSTDKASPCTLATSEGGMYKVTASITDDKGRANQTELSIWVAGGKLPPQRGVEIEEVRLLGDKWDPLESTCRHASLSIL